MTPKARLGRFLIFALILCAAAQLAHAQMKIDKAKSVKSMFVAPDGRVIIFYVKGRYRPVSCTISTDATAKKWSKPFPISRFGSAAMASDGTIYIACFSARSFVLDAMVPGKEVWKHKKDLARIHAIQSKGRILGPTTHLVIEKAVPAERLWVSCAWREDENLGRQTVSTKRFIVLQADTDKLKFAKSWEGKGDFVKDYGHTTLSTWRNRPVLYSPQHYVCGLAAFDGKNWNVREKLFDYHTVNGWVGAYGSPPPRLTSTANGYLHIAQYVSGMGNNTGGSYLISVSEGGKVSHLEIGAGREVAQFVTTQADSVIVGVKYTVIKRIEDFEERYQNFYAICCTPDAATKKYKKAKQELSITETETMKDNMAAPACIKPGAPLPVAYIEEGQLYFMYVAKPPAKRKTNPVQ